MIFSSKYRNGLRDAYCSSPNYIKWCHWRILATRTGSHHEYTVHAVLNRMRRKANQGVQEVYAKGTFWKVLDLLESLERSRVGCHCKALGCWIRCQRWQTQEVIVAVAEVRNAIAKGNRKWNERRWDLSLIQHDILSCSSGMLNLYCRVQAWFMSAAAA